jgi:hypothetical protein
MKGIGVGKAGKQNYSFTGISLIVAIIFTAGIVSVASCTKMSEFTIGKDFLDSQTKLRVLDTFKVDLSTILVDSLRTSDAQKMLAGSYKDTVFGSVKCESYFDLKYSSISEVSEKAIFDSSVFIFPYSGYSYGDTTSLMSLSIHRLTEDIVYFSDTYLYNNSSFTYSPEPEGTVKFYPTPNSADSAVYVHVNNLGEELFNFVRNKNEIVSSEELFNNYYKGFVLTPDSSDNKAVIGFDAAAGKIEFKIYYHVDNIVPELKEITIEMGPSANQFNNISYDFSNTYLKNIRLEKNEMSSAETGNKGYMQGLVGLLPKITFPTLDDILEQQRWKILKAELVFEPLKGSYDLFKLPKKLILFDTDKGNRIISMLTDSHNNVLTASFESDELYNRDTRYTFDITTFINDEFAGGDFNSEHGLLISLQTDEYKSSLDRILIEGKTPPVKLRLYYLSY